MCSLLIGAVALAFGHARALRAPMSRMLASRSLCDGLSTAGFIAALAHMKLANVAAVLQIAPLIITALSVVLYREVVGWRRWTAIGVGFVGALLVDQADPVGVQHLGDRRRGLGASPPRCAKSRPARSGAPCRSSWSRSGVRSASRCAALVFIVTEDWRMFAGGDLFQLFVAAVFVGIAIYLLALGFRDVDLSVVAPFRYSYLLTSALGGFLVFREVPDGWTVVGRGPDRGQRHLRAASRGGAPAHR